MPTRSGVVVIFLVFCLTFLGVSSVCSAQAAYGGVRSRANRPSDSLGSFRPNLGTNTLRGFSLDTLRSQAGGGGANTSIGSYQPTRSTIRSKGFGFGHSALSSGLGDLSLGGARSAARLSTSSVGIGGIGGMAPPSIFNFPARSSGTDSLMFGQAVPLAKDEAIFQPEAPDILAEDLVVLSASRREALNILMGKGLQRPSLGLMTDRPSLTLKSPGQRAIGYEDEGACTFRARTYATRQMNCARKFVRAKSYEQALVCYKSAAELAPRNAKAAIGTIYCRLLTGRYQSAGLEVLRLAEIWPDFWTQQINYTAVFGVAPNKIVELVNEVEPKLDGLITLYGEGERDRNLSRQVTLIWLCKLYLAWLNGQDQLVHETIEKAAEFSPFYPEVQGLYRRITGRPPVQPVSALSSRL